MPLIYSDDLRKRAMELVDEGKMSYTKIAEVLGINRKTLSTWRKLRKSTGSVKQPPIIFKGGSKPIVSDWEEFKIFAQTYSDKTTGEMAELWGSGSTSSIGRSLKKINFTRKKKLMDIKNVMKKKDKTLNKK